MPQLSPSIKKCLKTTYMLYGLSEFNLYKTWWEKKSILYDLYRQAPETFVWLTMEGCIIPHDNNDEQIYTIKGFNVKLNPDKLKEYMND